MKSNGSVDLSDGWHCVVRDDGHAGATCDVPATVTAGSGLAFRPPAAGGHPLRGRPGDRDQKPGAVRSGGPTKADDLERRPLRSRYRRRDSASFFVTAGPVSSIAFLARPSRVPSNDAQRDQRNRIPLRQVSEPGTATRAGKVRVDGNGQMSSRTETTRRAASPIRSWIPRAKKAPAQFVASSGIGFGSTRGARGGIGSLQHSDARRSADKTGILVRTDPITIARATRFLTAPLSLSPRWILAARAQSMRASSRGRAGTATGVERRHHFGRVRCGGRQ